MASRKRFCPGCERKIRVTDSGVWFKHHLNAIPDDIYEDTCMNSKQDPEEGYFYVPEGTRIYSFHSGPEGLEEIEEG